MQEELLTRLRELLRYDPLTGEVQVAKSSRLLTPDHDGLVAIFDSEAKPKLKKYKLDKLAFALGYGYFPDKSRVILHKNLNSADNRICNLADVSRAENLAVNAARKNLDGGIRYVQHPRDQYCYILYWYEGIHEKSKKYSDVVSVKKAYLQLQLESSKTLTKYCVFD